MTKPVVYIVIYSLYHHVYKLSLTIKETLESKGVDVKLFQVQETLSDDILQKMQAPPKPDLPIMTIDRLSEPDAIMFGLPTRFGTMPAQMKALLDASGALWAKGALAGKFAATFFSTASQNGGQETTALTAVTYFAHHGMLYVPAGYANKAVETVDEVFGGSAYGCGTISDGDGSRQPTALELSLARTQAENFAIIVSTFVKALIIIKVLLL
ncbi:NAD(P)H:quinone oxidoreductase, type IV [Helicostylum pulchrum]|nr:NAD(P)H:quinone oxidoreductase, type IV [Helicostylum pulchrum]